jgi:DNA modification methylase
MKLIKQLTLNGNLAEVTSLIEKDIDLYLGEFPRFIEPKGENVFGFWVQTIADIQLLELELKGLTESYKIDVINRTVEFEGDPKFVRYRVAHLEKVQNEKTLYVDFVDTFNDTNAYAFHNLYPYKGKFYPRIVRTLINAFELDEKALILDPFNGSGTTTHEASLMGIKSVGVELTPMGVIMSKLKNDLLFIRENELKFTEKELKEIFRSIEAKSWEYYNDTIHKLMLILYFDTIDAFERTSRYKKKGKVGLFIEKYRYILDCYNKTMNIKKKWNLNFVSAEILEGDILELKKFDWMEEKFDAVITSPPYFFSIDYVGKDKVAYEYLGISMEQLKSKYLGMKNNVGYKGKYPARVIQYYVDLKRSIENIYWALKDGGKLAIIVGDSTFQGKKLPTTLMTKKFCEEVGFKFEKLIFNPLLGERNRAIRGESIIICSKT